MYKLCKTEQSAARQREIEAALFEILKSKRYEDITITELCDKMLMPRKAFYRYFDSKEDALYAFLDHSMSDYTGFAVEHSGEVNRSLTRELEEYFLFWYERREVLVALDRSGLMGTLMERMINYPIRERIAVARFLPDDSDDMRERVFRFAFAGLVYTMIEWYRDGFGVSARDMARAACRMFNKPLFPRLCDIGMGE